MSKGKLATTFLLALGVAACGSQPIQSSPGYGQTYSSQYGRVSAIELVRGSGDSSGMGAVVGGVVGGVLGHQIGQGRGRDAATIAGAVGGAVAGNEIEKRSNADDRYRVSVRLDNGAYQTFEMDTDGSLRVGDRVRIEGNRPVRY